MDVQQTRETLNRMVNEHYHSPEMLRFFAFPITLPRAKVMFSHTLHFNMNRRNCWGYVQGSCPPEVKRLVWEHEKEELVCDPRFGGDHHTAALSKAMKMTGLSAEELYTIDLIPGCKAGFRAWLNLAGHSSWLTAFSASTILERANNNAVVKGGGVAVRDSARYTPEVAKLLGQVAGHDVHNVADEDHSDMMEEVLDRYVRTEEDRREVLTGAKESLEFDRAYRGALGVALEQIGG